MKKKRTNLTRGREKVLQNLWRKMKLTLLFSFLVIFQVGAIDISFAQKKVSLSLEDVTLEEFFTELRRQTGDIIVFSNTEINAKQKVTVHSKDEAIGDILGRVLKGLNLGYKQVEDYIVIYKPDVQQVKTKIVVGTVSDEEKAPMPGVTVMIKGTTVGVVTDRKGWYRLPLPDKKDMALLFSFVGMKTIEVKYTGQDTINVILKEDIMEVEEVVVTGYQTIKEKAMTGAYSKIKGEDLLMTGTETIESMLQGKIPGMMVINTSGLTGTRQKVRVRGISTLVGNAEPVWVVDGIIQEDPIPFESQSLVAMSDDNLDMMKDFIGGAVSWLNPNDIDDITVLKDASATAIYGVKAANGVIVITTKKGQKGRLSVNYDGRFSMSQRMNYKRQEIMNSRERVDLSREAWNRGARMSKEAVGYSALAYAYTERQISWEEFDAGVKKLETVNTDWFDILYRTPFSQSHSVSFSGGNDDATYRASFSYNNVKNTAKGNEQTAYRGSLNTTMTFWKKLTLSASLSGNHTETKAFATGVDPFNYAISTSRVIACHDDGNELFYYDKGGRKYNILNELANSGNENVLRSISVNLSARWRLIEDLTLILTAGGCTQSSFAETWFTERSHRVSVLRGYEYGECGVMDSEFQNSPLPYGGMLTVSESRNFNYTARFQAEYMKLLNGVHFVSLMAGTEARSNKSDGYSQTNWGYMPDRGKSFTEVPIQTPSGTLNATYARTNPKIKDQIANTVSYYCAASYMYDDRYSINLSVRGDGSNSFGEQGDFLPVWSVGLRWNVAEEHWMANQNIVNNLSFSANIGYQGSVVTGVGPDLVAKILPVSSSTGEYQMTWSQLPNPNLKWEKTLSVNLGVNFALFKNKVNTSFNYYYKKTTDVISSLKIPYENGTTTMYLNSGNVTNKGWDMAFSLVPIRTKDFMWSLSTTFSGNDNKVNSNVEQNGSWINATNGSLNKKGYPIGSFWAFDFTGLNPENGGPMFDLSRAASDKAAEDATEYMVYMGTREPKFTVGINMVFRWKRFSFPLNFYVSRGNYEFLSSPYENGYAMLSEFQNASKELKDRWRKPGDEKHTNIPSIPVNDNCRPLYPFEDGKTMLYPLEAWRYSSVRVVNAWYIRFNDFSFSYNLPDKWVKGFAKSVSFSFAATNPLQIKSKDFKGRDPEVALGSQPRSQNFSFGVSMSF